MYSETKKAGIKQFCFSILMMLILYLVSKLIFLLPSGRLAQLILILLIYCAAVYIVYIRYTPTYTFTLSDKELTAFADAGRKTDSVTVPYKKIKAVWRGLRPFQAPLSKKVFSTSIFPNKNYCYIVYNGKCNRKNALILETSREFYDKLKKHIK